MLSFATSADQAIELADSTAPDIVVTELSLAGHSGLEFLYEFRSYIDWRSVPVIIYTSQKVDDTLQNTHDWKQLGITQYLYKPHTSLQQLTEAIQASLGT